MTIWRAYPEETIRLHGDATRADGMHDPADPKSFLRVAISSALVGALENAHCIIEGGQGLSRRNSRQDEKGARSRSAD